jgi:hypothetical protein
VRADIVHRRGSLGARVEIEDEPERQQIVGKLPEKGGGLCPQDLEAEFSGARIRGGGTLSRPRERAGGAVVEQPVDVRRADQIARARTVGPVDELPDGC